MLVTRRSVVISVVALLSIIAGAIGMLPSFNAGHVAHAATATAQAQQVPRIHSSTTANGPYTVKGNMIVDASNNPYLFHGVGRDGLEYDCNGDGFFDATHLAFMGPGTNGSNGIYWYSNTVRLPLSEGFWLKGRRTVTVPLPA